MKTLARTALACFALWLAVAPASAAGQKAGEGSALDRFLGNQPQFFKLLPFNIPVIRNGAVVNQISFVISIETFGQTDKEKVIKARLKLQNAFLRDLYGVMALRHGDGRPYIAESVKIRLTRLAKNIVGGNAVKDVLIESSINMPLKK
jgi:hypothetical protein